VGEVVGEHRVRVEVDAAEVDRPGEPGGVVDHRFLRRRAGGVLELDHVHEVGAVLRRTLLEERLLADSLDEPLEHHRAAADATQRSVGHREVVPDEVELGQAELVEDDLVRVGDRDLVPGHLERSRHRHAITLRRTPRHQVASRPAMRPGMSLTYCPNRGTRSLFEEAGDGDHGSAGRRVHRRIGGLAAGDLPGGP
jgi:hypothetical protein